MIITKLSLPRRTFLRGAGAALALPLLDAMVPSLVALAKTAAAPVHRLGFVYVPNGVIQPRWRPTGTGTVLELGPTLSPLEPFKAYLNVVSGLAHRQAESIGDGNGDHARGQTAWLSGVHAKRTEGAAQIKGGITADQIAAQQFARHTSLASLELALEGNDTNLGNCDNGYSCTYMNTLSWRSATTPNPMEVHPRVVFERLFGDGGSPAQRLGQMRKANSILDSVTVEATRLQQTLGAGDRGKVVEYLEAVRDVEKQIQTAERQSAERSIELPDRPIDIPATFDEHAKLMFDLQVLAYQADITRVVSFQLAREQSQRTYPGIGVPDPHHSVSHHRDQPDLMAKKAKIDTYHVQMLGYLLAKLQATPDGDGTLLDHVVVLYGGGLGNGNLHDHRDLPVLLAGTGSGQLKAGRHLSYPEDTPMANLLLTLLDKVGVPTDRVGDSNGRLDLGPAYLPGV
jgi:Protein of unknown function (DUF1552)